MSRQELEEIYREAWSLYYTPDHIKTLVRRAVATGLPMLNIAKYILLCSTTERLEGMHPLQGGIVRLKRPGERRPGLPRERLWIFWPRFAWETIAKHGILAGMFAKLLLWKIAIARDPLAKNYMDKALAPVEANEVETLQGAYGAVAHVKKVAELTSVSERQLG